MLRGRGNTPLHCAAQNGHTTIMDRLVAAGAAVDAKTNGGRTPWNLLGASDRPQGDERSDEETSVGRRVRLWDLRFVETKMGLRWVKRVYIWSKGSGWKDVSLMSGWSILDETFCLVCYDQCLVLFVQNTLECESREAKEHSRDVNESKKYSNPL